MDQQDSTHVHALEKGLFVKVGSFDRGEEAPLGSPHNYPNGTWRGLRSLDSIRLPCTFIEIPDRCGKIRYDVHMQYVTPGNEAEDNAVKSHTD